MPDHDDECVAKLREQNARLHYQLADSQLRHQLYLSKARWVIANMMAYVADEKTRDNVVELLSQIDEEMKVSGDVFEAAPALRGFSGDA